MGAKASDEQLRRQFEELTQDDDRRWISDICRSLVDSTTDSIYIVDRQCRYLFLNEVHFRRMNLPGEQILGKTYAELHPEGSKGDFEKAVRSVYETGRSIKRQHRSSRDGCFFLRTFSPMRKQGGDGHILGVAVVSKDISELKKAEETLRFTQLSIDRASDAILWLDSAGKILKVNESACFSFEYSREELLAKNVAEIDSRIAARGWPSTWTDLRDRGALIYESYFIRRDGKTLPFEVKASFSRIGDREYAVAFCRDIAERKRLENQFYLAQKMDALGTMAGGIVHDFNNILMVIQGHVSLMMMGADSGHPNYERLQGIEQMVASGAALTKQLLSFARGEKCEMIACDINEIVKKTLEIFKRTKKDIQVHTRFDRHPSIVEADSSQIEQVLLNLFVNAWQAMPGGGNLYISTANTVLDDDYVKPYRVSAGRYIKITVTDTGAGMDAETLNRIFDPFFTTRGDGKGVGLGLATSYGIIKKHGGIFNVYSEKGSGATFNIYLPASERSAAQKQPEETSTVVKGSETVLFADDEEVILEVGREILMALGYRVITARGGAAAIEIYRQKMKEIPIIVLDMIMPGMKCTDVVAALKQCNPGVKILLASGYAENNQVRLAMDSGCRDFIQKPFNIPELSRKLRRVLED